MIKADEARALMPQNIFNDEIKKIEDRIKHTAKQGRNSLRLMSPLIEVKGDVCNLTPLGEKVKEHLEKNGYSVTSFYDCDQFVDVGYRVSWDVPK